MAKKQKKRPAKAKPKAARRAPRPKVRKPVKKPAATKRRPAPPAKKPRRPKIMEKPSKKSAKSALRDSILARKTAKPIAFSLDEVRAIAQTNVPKGDPASAGGKAPAKAAVAKAAAAAPLAKPAKPTHVKAASLSDILGFNPRKAEAPAALAVHEVPEKFRRFYRLLLDLRQSLTEGIELHSEETLKRSAKEDSGDLSSYGQHMADAGTDTFDRDFALSLVSSEQEALAEIDAAIKRIREGTYGICEVTQKPIAKERLLVVPFTRYSTEAQKDIERNRHRSRTQAGLLGELGEEGGKLSDDDGGGED